MRREEHKVQTHEVCKDFAMSAIASQNLNRASNFAIRGKKAEVNSPFLRMKLDSGAMKLIDG